MNCVKWCGKIQPFLNEKGKCRIIVVPKMPAEWL